jgi:hypothetical protein
MTDKPERPIHEPEIIPPDRAGGRRGGDPADGRVFVDYGGAQRIHVVRLGPVGAALIGLLVAVLAALILLLLVGAFLIWIPLVALFIAAMVISGLLRAYFQRRG